jgi:hypothetical protein
LRDVSVDAFDRCPSVSADGVDCGYPRLQVIVEQIEFADPVGAWNIDFITVLCRVGGIGRKSN